MKRVTKHWIGRTFLLAGSVLLVACSSLSDSSILVEAIEKTTIYLVRHAEKANGSRDPELNQAGFERADRLAQELKNVAIDKLWSSDYERTRQTLAPLARLRGIAVAVYDARNSRDLISAIFEADAGKTHVIAGHSNTVPALVDILEAWPAESSAETARPNLGHEEYDRLYVVTLVSGRPAVVDERRY